MRVEGRVKGQWFRYYIQILYSVAQVLHSDILKETVWETTGDSVDLFSKIFN